MEAINKVFLDTNVIVDVLMMRPGFESAATVLAMGAKGEMMLYITNLTLANTLYIVRKDLGREQALAKMKLLCRYVHIAPSTQKETDQAFSTVNPDFEDALQYFSAQSVNADVILTRNQKHFLYSKIPVMDCDSFIDRLG